MKVFSKWPARVAVLAPLVSCLLISGVFTVWFGISLARVLETNELRKQSENIGLLSDYIQHLVDDMLTNAATLSAQMASRPDTPLPDLAAVIDGAASSSHIRAIALFDGRGMVLAGANDMTNSLEAQLPLFAEKLERGGEPIFLPLSSDEPQARDIPRFAVAVPIAKSRVNIVYEVSADGRKQRAANIRTSTLQATLAMFDTASGAVVTFGGNRTDGALDSAAAALLQDIGRDEKTRCTGTTILDRRCAAFRPISHSSLVMAGLVDRDMLLGGWLSINRPLWIFAALVVAGGAASSASVYIWARQRKKDREQLRAALGDVQRLYAVKSNFMAHLSHELRTPLNSIIGFSDLMRSALFGPLDRRYQDYAEDIHAAASHMHGLASDIMDAERLERGELTLEPGTADLKAVAAEAVRCLAHFAEARRVTVEIAPPPPVAALVGMNRHRTAQIALNLLSNAVKYSEPGDRVVLAVERDAGQIWSLVIADEGIGMTADEIAFTERPFGQPAEHRSARHDSVGLGLPIVRGLLAAAGGYLHILSEKAKGTTVTATFPPCLEQPRKDDTTALPASSHSGGQRRDVA